MVNPNKRWAMVALNSKTLSLANTIKEYYSKRVDVDLFKSLKDIDRDTFSSYDAIIYIMAMGIVVRHIAPYIKDKRTDPAIICIQSRGEYVIPVLSGHIGGANALSIELASALGAKAVITTASDLFHTTAIDLFSKKYHLTIDSFEDAKIITAMLIEHRFIGLMNKAGIHFLEEDIKDFVSSDQDTRALDGIVLVSHQKKEACLGNCSVPVVHLIPQNIILALGCRKDKSGQEIKAFIQTCLEEVKIDPRSVKYIVSVDLKKDEAGLLQMSQEYKVPFITYSTDEIKKVEKHFPVSPFVKKTLGVGSVSMPTGYLASNKGTCIMPRRASNGITLSIWEETQC